MVAVGVPAAAPTAGGSDRPTTPPPPTAGGSDGPTTPPPAGPATGPGGPAADGDAYVNVASGGFVGVMAGQVRGQVTVNGATVATGPGHDDDGPGGSGTYVNVSSGGFVGVMAGQVRGPVTVDGATVQTGGRRADAPVAADVARIVAEARATAAAARATAASARAQARRVRDDAPAGTSRVFNHVSGAAVVGVVSDGEVSGLTIVM